MEIKLYTQTKWINRWLNQTFQFIGNCDIPDRISIKHEDSNTAFCFYDAKTKIFRISRYTYLHFDCNFAEFYYYEKDFRNIIKEYVQTRYNIEIKKVWIGC